MVDRVNEDTRNATVAQEGQEASMTDSQDSGTPQFSESVAQLAQNEPENAGEDGDTGSGDTGQGTPDNPQELISQALAVLAEQGFDVEDGIDLQDPAVVAALQDAGINIDQLVLAVAEVTGEQIEPAAGPEAGPNAVGDGGGDRFAPTDPGSIDDGIGINGLLGPRGLEPTFLEVEPTGGFGDALDLSVSVAVQTDIDGIVGLGLYEDWQPIQAESQDATDSSSITDADTDFDTQMYETLRSDDDYTPFDALGNPGEDFLFPGNLVFDITTEPDTIDVDYGPLEISGAPAGSYLFYVEGGTIQRFDFVDGTEIFTLGDVSEAYLEGNNIFFLAPEDSDTDVTLNVSLDVEALDETVTVGGDVQVILDAVADLPEIEVGESSNFDGDTFSFNEDHSLEGGEGGEGSSDSDTAFDQDGVPGEEPCYQGWTLGSEPTYGLPFTTAITDNDLALGRDEPSEGLIQVTLALSENPNNDTDVASALPEFGQYDEEGGQDFYASIAGQRLDSESISNGGVQVTLSGQYWSDETGLQSGPIHATVTLGESGELVFDNFQVISADNEPIEGLRVQEIDYSSFQVHLPQHADNGLQLTVTSTSRELRVDTLPEGDEELTLANNEATSEEVYNVEIRAVADGAKISITLESYEELNGNCSAHGQCAWGDEADPQYGSASIVFTEDGEKDSEFHGPDFAESPLQIPMHFTADLIDQDGSESVTQFMISLEGAAEGTHFLDADGNALTDGQVITIDGVEGTVSLDGSGNLIVDFGENAVSGQNLNVTGEIGIELPIDSSQDFRADISVTTTKTDPTNPDAVAQSSRTTHTSIDFGIGGVAGSAAAGFGNYAEAEGLCRIAEDGSVVLVEDGESASSEHGPNNSESALVIPVKYSATTQDSDGSEGVTEIVLDKGASDGVWTAADGSALGSSVEIDGLTWNVSENDAGQLVLTYEESENGNQAGPETVDLSGVVGIALPIDDSTDFTLTGWAKTQEYDDDAFAEDGEGRELVDGWAEVNDCGDKQAWNEPSSIDFKVSGVAGPAESGFGDYAEAAGLCRIAEDGSVVLVEDGESSSSAHGANDSESARIIDVKYVATTQDSDGSEGVTEIVLDKGASDGVWMDQSSGDPIGSTIVIDGATWNVSENDAGQLVLTYDEAENGNQAGPETVDLSGVVGIELPIDDSTDFTLTGRAKTQEYDDDAFAEDGQGRELVDGWEEVNDCGDKQAWNEPSSIDFKVSGVSDPAEGGFGDYAEAEGLCRIAEDGSVVLVEDGEASSSAHGENSSESTLVIPVKYAATTQDGDGSEGVTEIVLDKGASDGAWTAADGSPLDSTIVIDGATWNVSENDEGQLVLSYDEAENGNQAGPEAVDLSGVVGIELPIDDSTDFTLTGRAKTQEYDDDAFAEDGEGRELVDGWEEVNDCGDKQAWNEPSSVDFKVSGVAGPAEAGFGDYSDAEGFCRAEDGSLVPVEDGEKQSSEHGFDGDESGLVIPVNYTAQTQDSDGSEGIVTVRLSNTSDGGSWVVGDVSLEVGGEPTEVEVPGKDGGPSTPAMASVNDSGELVLSFADPGAESVDLSNLVGIELPIDDSSDFSIGAETTTRDYDDDAFSDLSNRELKDGYEFDPEDPECADREHTTESSLDVKISGVAGPADGGFGEYEGDCAPIYGEGSETVSTDLSGGEAPSSGVSLYGFGFGSAFAASGLLDLSGAAAGSVTFDPNGAGVLVGNEDRGLQVPDQVGHDPATGESEALVAELDGPASSVTVTVSNLFNNEQEGEYGQVTLFNPAGQEIGTVLFGSSEDAPEGYEGVYQQVAFNEGSDNVGTITLETSELCEGSAIGALAFQAAPYGGVASEDGEGQASDSSDYFVREIDYTKAEQVGYTLVEDGESSSSAHGANDSETARVIDVKYAATTQDSDGSEGVTEIVLDKGASDGVWVDQSSGDPIGSTIVIDGATWNVSENDAGQLVLTYDEAENGNQAGPETVDLSGVVGIELPIDDSTDFTLTGRAKTQEYDDDAFAEDGQGRELVDGWEEVNDCGDKQAWNEPSSVDFKVSGVAGPTEGGFGEYEGDCKPVYEAGEGEPISVDLTSSEDRGSITLKAFTYGEGFVDGEGKLDTSAGSDSDVKVTNRGLGVTSPQEVEAVPHQINHDPETEGGATEGLLVGLGEATDTVTVTVSNLFQSELNVEGADEYGRVTLFNGNGEEVGSYIFGLERPEGVPEDQFIQVENYNASQGVGTIEIPVQDGCFFSDMVFTAEPYLNLSEEQRAELGGASSDYFVRDVEYTPAEQVGYTLVEDGESSSSAHGANDSETARVIDVKYSVTTQDSDGSEGVTEIMLDKGASDGSWVDTTSGEAVALEDGGTIQIDGATWDVAIDDEGVLTLSYDETKNGNIAGPEVVDLSGVVGIELPIDDSTDFTLTGQAKTQEYDDDAFAEDGEGRELVDGWEECNDCGDKQAWNEPSSVDFKISGVAGPAESGFGEYEGADGYCGEEKTGFSIGEPDTISEFKTVYLPFIGPVKLPVKDISSESDAHEIVRSDLMASEEGAPGSIYIEGFEYNGPDVLVETDGVDLYSLDLREGETVEIDGWSGSLGEGMKLYAIGPDGEETELTPDEDGVIRYDVEGDGSYQFKVDVGESGISFYGGTLTVKPSETPTYIFSEDAEASSDQHGEDGSESALVIPVKYSADTQDGDGSEGITEIVLDKGESQGAWTAADGSALGSSVEIDGLIWNVSENDEGQLVLSYDETANGNQAGPESVDLSGVIGVKLPVDDSTDFTLSGKTKTQEYDDDAFTGEGRELIENWEDCNGCGDKNEWSGWESVDIRVDGVAGPATTTNLGYEEGENGYCGLEPTGFTVGAPEKIIEFYPDTSPSNPREVERSEFGAEDDFSSGSVKILGGGLFDSSDAYSFELREGETLTINGKAGAVQWDGDDLDLGGLNLSLKDENGNSVELDYNDGVYSHKIESDGQYQLIIEPSSPSLGMLYGGTVTIEPSETPTYVFSEDAGDQDITKQQEPLNIPVNYTAETQDSDGSEGITRVSLSLGAAIAGMSWTKDGNALEDGDTVMLTDQENGQTFEATASISGDGSELTLNIPAPGIQNLDLSADELGIELPKDYSGEFSLNVDTTTTEFDDDFLVIDEDTGERSLSEGNGEFDPECAEDTHTVSDSVNYKISSEVDPAKTGWKGEGKFGEDGGEIGADCQDPDAGPLSIPAHFFAKVQDVDGSESITGLKLSFDLKDGDGEPVEGGSFAFLQDGDYVSFDEADQPLLVEAVGKVNGDWDSVTLKVTQEGDGFLFTPVNADGSDFEGQSGIELIKFKDGEGAPVQFTLPEHFNGEVSVDGSVQTTEYGPIYEGCEDCEPKDSRWTDFDKDIKVKAINDKPLANDVDSESECAVPEEYMDAFNGDGVPSAEDVIAFKAFDVTDFGSQDGLEENGSELGGWDVEGDDLTYTICEQPEYGALYKWDGESLTKLENGDSFTSEDEVIWAATAEETALSYSFDSAASLNDVPLKGYLWDGAELSCEELAYKNDPAYGDGVGVGSPVRDQETSTDGERVEKVVFGGQEGKLYSGATVSLALLFAGEGGAYEADGNPDTDESMEWFAIRDGEIVDQGTVDGTQDGNASFTVNTAFDSLMMKPVDNGQGASSTNSDFVISDIEAREVPQDAGFTYCVSDGECTVEGNVTLGVDTKPFADDVQAESACYIPEDVQSLFSDNQESNALDGAVSFKEFSVDSLVGDHEGGGDSSLGGFDYQTAGEDLTFKLHSQPDFGTLYRYDGDEITEMEVGDTFSISDRIFWVAKEEDAVKTDYGVDNLSGSEANADASDWADSFGSTLEGFRDGTGNQDLSYKYDGGISQPHGGIAVGGGRDGGETDWAENSVEKLVFTPGQTVMGATVTLGLFFGGENGPYEANAGVDAEKMQWVAYNGGEEVASGTEFGTEDGLKSFDIDVPFDKLELKPLDNDGEGANLSDFVLRGIETKEIPQETGFDYGVYDDPDCENCVDTGTVTIDVGAQPIANDDSNELTVDCEDSTPKAEGNLLANDYDEGGELSVTSVKFGEDSVSFEDDGQTDGQGNSYVEIDGDYGTLKVYENGDYEYVYEGQPNLPADLTENGDGLGDASLHGYQFGETYLDSDGKLDIGNLVGDGNVTRTSNGAGVVGNQPGLQVSSQVNHDPNGEGSEALIVDLGNSSRKATVGLSNLFNDENTGEYGLVKAYDGAGNLVGTAVFGPNDPNIEGVDFIPVVFEDGSNNQGTIDLDCGTFCGGKPFQYLAFAGVEYGAELGEGGDVPSDSSDYFVSSIESTKAVGDGDKDVFEYSVKDGEGCETTANLTIDINSDEGGTPTCEACNTPPQADNVNSTAVLLSEYEDGDLDSAMDEFNLEEGDYTFVREFSVNNIVGEDGDGESEDTSLGGYDLETPLGNLGFQITEAPQSGTLLIKDGDSYTKIDAGTDPNDLPTDTFSSNAKVWWLGDSEGVASDSAYANLDLLGAESGNLGPDPKTIDDSNLGNITFTSLISDGEGGFEKGGDLFYTNGNGLGVQASESGSSNNQIDEDERLEITFDDGPVESVTMTVKPYNGVPDDGVAFTIVDSNGDEYSGAVTHGDIVKNGAEGTFTINLSDLGTSDVSDIKTIQIGPNGSEGVNQGANFSLKELSVTREGASFLQDSFKYEVIDDCDEVSDEATVIIGAEGGEIVIEDPEDGFVKEKGLAEGSYGENDSWITDNGDLGITWISGGGDKSLTFSDLEDQPDSLKDLKSNGTDVDININGNVLTGTADGEDIFEVTLNDDGTYDFELKGNLDHGDGNGENLLDLDFAFEAEQNGSSESGSFTVEVKDDIPEAMKDHNDAVVEEPDPVNLTLVMDRSWSMNEGNRFSEMKAAAQSLVAAYAATGAALHLNIISFSNAADIEYSGSDSNVAISEIANLTDPVYSNPEWGTSFPAALDETESVISSNISNGYGDYLQKVYFLSDADEYGGSQYTDLDLSGTWEDFRNNNPDLDITAVSIEEDSTGALAAITGDEDKVLMVDNVAELEETLLGTIGEPVTGNLINNDLEGADGSKVHQVRIEEKGWISFPDGEDSLTIKTDNGKLVVHKDGSYEYTPYTHAEDGATDVFDYRIKDGDGDFAQSKLCISIDNNMPVLPQAYNNTAVVEQSEVVPDQQEPQSTTDPIGDGTLDDGETESISGVNEKDEVSFSWYFDGDKNKNEWDGDAKFKIKDESGAVVKEYDLANASELGTGANGGVSGSESYEFTSSGSYTFEAVIEGKGGDVSLQITNLQLTSNDQQEPSYISNKVSGNVIDMPNHDPDDIANHGKQDNPANDPNAGSLNSWVSNIESDKDGEKDVNSGSVTTIKGSYGTLEIEQDGSYTYTTSDDKSESGTDTFTYTLKTAEGETTADLVIDVRDGAVNQDDYLGGFRNVELDDTQDDYTAPTDDIESYRIVGSDGDNELTGTAQNDVLIGGDGVDILEGNDGGDLLSGGRGDDDLFGGDGEDILIGGAGKNTMDGGDGKDTFVFDDEALADLLTNGDGNADSINNFDTGDDSIDLSALSDVLYDQENLIGNVHMDDDGNLTVDVRNEDGQKETVKVAEVYSDEGTSGVSDAQVYIDDNNSENIA